MNTPTVSIVMSVLNGERFLREALDSLLCQTFTDFEVLAVNDGSTDRTRQILDRYSAADSRVRVIHQQNQGLVASLNLGCGRAAGKYIARMDADDVSLPDRLERQVAFCEAHPEVGVAGGAIELIDAAGRSHGTSRNPAADSAIRAGLARGGTPLWHPTVMMRREVWRAAGGYRKAFADAEDFDLWLRIAERHPLANLESIVLRYRLHASQVSVRKYRQQVLSNVAARLSAEARKQGRPDPFEDRVEEITEALLVSLGAERKTLQSAMARSLLSCIRNMRDAGEREIAAGALKELRSLDWPYVEAPIRADMHLLESRLLWRQGQRREGLQAAWKAVQARPRIVGRPVKALFQRLRMVPAY